MPQILAFDISITTVVTQPDFLCLKNKFYKFLEMADCHFLSTKN